MKIKSRFIALALLLTALISCDLYEIDVRVPVTGILLNKNTTIIPIGESEQLIPFITPSNAYSFEVYWRSLNPDIATVNAKGEVNAISIGKAIITATSINGGLKDSCEVMVVIPTSEFSLSNKLLVMDVGDTNALIATKTIDIYDDEECYSWRSGNEDVASVENGVVVANGKGSTIITVTSEDGKYTETCNVFVGQDPYVSKWNVIDKITLPLVRAGNYNFLVNWGDGSSDYISSWDNPEKTHSYASSGIYEVEINGIIRGWSFFEEGSSRKNIIEVSKWGPFSFAYSDSHFYECSNLTICAEDIPDMTTSSLSRTFQNCSSIKEIPGIENWNISNVYNMSRMFSGAIAFNGDLAGWNTSKVKDMNSMFSGAEAFNKDISKWNTSRVIDMSLMFSGAKAFNGDLADWDISEVTDMNWMFFDTNISIENYDTLLVNWSKQNVQHSVRFDGGTSRYSSDAAAEARQRLINDYCWIITDGGQVEN